MSAAMLRTPTADDAPAMSNGLKTIALDTKREMRRAEWLRRQAEVARSRGDDDEALRLFAVRGRQRARAIISPV